MALSVRVIEFLLSLPLSALIVSVGTAPPTLCPPLHCCDALPGYTPAIASGGNITRVLERCGAQVVWFGFMADFFDMSDAATSRFGQVRMRPSVAWLLKYECESALSSLRNTWHHMPHTSESVHLASKP
jgi:hypothetical protein